MGERQRNSVGTSLRGCIRDIVDRNHPIERVEYIVSKTEFATLDELIAYLTAGKVTQKERVIDVATRLWNNGKIAQPKIDGRDVIEPTGVRLWVDVPPKKAAAPVRAMASELF